MTSLYFVFSGKNGVMSHNGPLTERYGRDGKEWHSEIFISTFSKKEVFSVPEKRKCVVYYLFC